jgi:hypothetical protein
LRNGSFNKKGGINMRNRFRKGIAVTAPVIALAAVATLFTHTPSARAQGDSAGDESKIQQGFAIAPVPLNLAGKNRALVGMGSYLVNAVADCNGCHSAGPGAEFINPNPVTNTPGGNPYLLPQLFTGKTQVDPKTYLGGGYDFGSFPGPGPFAHVVSRNLTPDKFGLPEGHTFSEFVTILRTGRDFDNAHPTCGAIPNGQCIPFPFNGAVLQIMPWPAFQNMTDHDLLAIYTYLSAIPCLEGDPGVPPPPGGRQLRCQ